MKSIVIHYAKRSLSTCCWNTRSSLSSAGLFVTWALIAHFNNYFKVQMTSIDNNKWGAVASKIALNVVQLYLPNASFRKF